MNDSESMMRLMCAHVTREGGREAVGKRVVEGRVQSSIPIESRSFENGTHMSRGCALFISPLQEINNLKTELEATKFDVIKYCVGEVCQHCSSSWPPKTPTFWVEAVLMTRGFDCSSHGARYSRVH